MYSWAWEANYKNIAQPVRERVTASRLLLSFIFQHQHDVGTYTDKDK